MYTCIIMYVLYVHIHVCSLHTCSLCSLCTCTCTYVKGNMFLLKITWKHAMSVCCILSC